MSTDKSGMFMDAMCKPHHKHKLGWCLTALSAQKGYIMPEESSVLRQF